MRSALWYQKSKMYHKYFEQHEHEIVGMQLAWIFTWANSYWSGMLGTHQNIYNYFYLELRFSRSSQVQLLKLNYISICHIWFACT